MYLGSFIVPANSCCQGSRTLFSKTLELSLTDSISSLVALFIASSGPDLKSFEVTSASSILFVFKKSSICFSVVSYDSLIYLLTLILFQQLLAIFLKDLIGCIVYTP